MKKPLFYVLALFGLIAPLLLSGCGGSSGGEVITEKKDLANFTALEIGSAFEFDVTYSDSWGVTISADESLFDYIEITQSGTTLEILLSPHHIFTDFTLGSRVLKAEITMPSLSGLDVSGACNGEVSGFSSSTNLFLNVSGTSTVNLDGINTSVISGEISGASRVSGNVTATSVVLGVSGASKLSFDGSSPMLDIEVSGASTADLEGFIVSDVDADISGASSATVYAEKTLDVNVSGASRLYFIGNPTLGESSVSGASTIKHQE